MFFKNKSKKLVLSKIFLLIPILLAIIAFKAIEPVVSTIQGSDLDKRCWNSSEV